MKSVLFCLLITSCIGCRMDNYRSRRTAQTVLFATATSFNESIDSAEIVWHRGRESLRPWTPFAIDSDSLINSGPCNIDEVESIVIRRQQLGDSISFQVHPIYLLQPKSATQGIIATKQIAYYMQTGETYQQLQQRLRED